MVALSDPGWNGEWSKVKPLFLELQSDKCCYCEGEISGPPDELDQQKNLYDSDVEHFRPKKRVQPWPIPDGWTDRPDQIQNGPPTGYGWLAADCRNYLASCKPCNSGRKRNFFPIRRLLTDYTVEPSLDELAHEQPYLIFPYGQTEPRLPEDLIMFVGARAYPHERWPEDSFEYWQARITIEIVRLNRTDLVRPRLKLIAKLGLLFSLRSKADNSAHWEEILRGWCEAKEPYSSCCRYFVELYRRDSAAAFALAKDALRQRGREVEIGLLGA